MDLLTTDEERSPFPLLAALMAAFLVATAGGYLIDALRDDDGGRSKNRRAGRGNDGKGDPGTGIAQAPWEIKASVVGALADVGRAQRKRTFEMRKQLMPAVREIYDGLLVDPGSTKKVLKRWFTAPAARALRRDGVLRRRTPNVKTLSRRAHLGIDARGANRASAEVTIVYRTSEGDDAKKKPVRVQHSSTLWFEKEKRKWRVIAFSVGQIPKKDRA